MKFTQEIPKILYQFFQNGMLEQKHKHKVLLLHQQKVLSIFRHPILHILPNAKRNKKKKLKRSNKYKIPTK